LARLAERAVQIDDVQAIRAIVRELCHELDGIVVEDRRALALALFEANGLTVEQIDRGEQLHAAPMKFESMRCPTAWLFSGWN
jgi:hypothetical protein